VPVPRAPAEKEEAEVEALTRAMEEPAQAAETQTQAPELRTLGQGAEEEAAALGVAAPIIVGSAGVRISESTPAKVK